jgi:hypothetical protein
MNLGEKQMAEAGISYAAAVAKIIRTAFSRCGITLEFSRKKTDRCSSQAAQKQQLGSISSYISAASLRLKPPSV